MEQTTATGPRVVRYRPDCRKIDILNSEAFQESLLSRLADGILLVLDLGDVGFVDSSGLGKIIAAVRLFRERGGDLRVCSAQAPVKVLFSMVRLGDIVGIDADADTSERELLAGRRP